MYSLRVFGGISLGGPSGPLSGTAVQPRQSALLAVLAAAQQKGTSRDKVIGLLWPDRDQAEARHALSNSVYELRRALGEEAILVSGDNLRLNSEVIGTDIASFREALERGDLIGAVEAYTGPFLDGFYLSRAEVFERWVELERQRLAVQYAEALEALAESTEEAGELPRAVGLWQRLVAYDPYNSRFAVRLMQAMAAAGDPANALQYAKEHEDLLRRELDIDPPAEVLALAERLRREASIPTLKAEPLGVKGSTEGATGAVAQTPGASQANRRSRMAIVAAAATIAIVAAGIIFLPQRRLTLDKQRVVVVSFENRTGDDQLDPVGQMAADWISRGVARTGLMEVVPPSSALSAERGAMRKLGVLPGLDLARSTAQTTGSGTVIWGSYYLSRDSLYFDVRITDASNDRLLSAPEPVVVGLEDEVEAIVELQQRVMGALAVTFNPLLGESPAELVQPPQYEAYVEYAKGLDKLADLQWEDATLHMLRAAKLDSTFATAQLFASMGLFFTGRLAQTDSIARLVERSRDRLTPADREFLDFMTYYSRRDVQQAFEAARRRVAIAEDPTWLWMLTVASHVSNHPRSAVEASERIDVQLLSGKAVEPWYWHYLANGYHMLGEHEWELSAARQQQQLPEHSGGTYFWRFADEMRALAAMGRIAELRARTDDCLSQPQRENWLPTECLEAPVIELRAHGHRDVAQEFVERGLAWYRARTYEEAAELTGRAPSIIKWNHAVWLDWAGGYAEARRLYEQLIEDAPEDVTFLANLGVLAARLGDKAEALRIDARLGRRNDVYSVRSSTHHRASIAAQLGERDRALGFMREALSRGRWTMDFHADWAMEPLWDDPTFQELLEPKG
jgi:DNA-binding SARP family transcriptional activator